MRDQFALIRYVDGVNDRRARNELSQQRGDCITDYLFRRGAEEVVGVEGKGGGGGKAR